MKKWLVVAIVIGLGVGAGAWLWLRPGRVSAPSSVPSVPSAPAIPPEKLSRIDAALKTMTLRDKIASLLVLHTAGTDPTALGHFMDRYHLGGFILMGDNIPSADTTLRAETTALRGTDTALPRLVAIDQEGGLVRRLAGDTFASAEMLKNATSSAVYQAFSARSRMVQSVGATLNFGIIADTTKNPASFIYDRVLGTTPQLAADHVGAAVDATAGKTLSTLKHFPGHGETTGDSHSSIPSTSVSYDTWRRHDAPAFEVGIAHGADVVMMGHLRYTAIDNVPATLSKKWHTILRDGMHFTGPIITDDMIMLQNSGVKAYRDPVANAISAIDAGNTLLLYVLDNAGAANTKINPDMLIDGIIKAVNSGAISSQTIDDDARLALVARSQTASLVAN